MLMKRCTCYLSISTGIRFGNAYCQPLGQGKRLLSLYKFFAWILIVGAYLITSSFMGMAQDSDFVKISAKPKIAFHDFGCTEDDDAPRWKIWCKIDEDSFSDSKTYPGPNDRTDGKFELMGYSCDVDGDGDPDNIVFELENSSQLFEKELCSSSIIKLRIESWEDNNPGDFNSNDNRDRFVEQDTYTINVKDIPVGMEKVETFRQEQDNNEEIYAEIQIAFFKEEEAL